MNKSDIYDIRGMLENEELKSQLRQAVAKRRRDSLAGSERSLQERTVYLVGLTEAHLDKLKTIAERQSCTVDQLCETIICTFLRKMTESE